MNETRLTKIVTYRQEYCIASRGNEITPIKSIEEGVEAIKKVLDKDTLCLHDVKEINRIYKDIETQERGSSQIPLANSCSVLNLIAKKINFFVASFSKKYISPETIISMYHLKKFEGRDLLITSIFGEALGLIKSSGNVKELATKLPCCGSEEEFKQAVETLIGAHPHGSDIDHILNSQRDKFIIQSKLMEMRKEDPQNYPSYLDEIMDQGYVQLCGHIIKMKSILNREQRTEEIEKLSFSVASHIILQTKELIEEKVKKSILPSSKKNVFLVGGSGAGKSTTLCFLRGDKMVLQGSRYISDNDQKGMIGHSQTTSCTFLPSIEVVDGVSIVDFPGFDDSHGQLISLGIELALKSLIKNYSPTLLVIESITNNSGRYAAAHQLGVRLSRLIDNKEECILGITQYSKDPDFIKIKAIEDKQRKELNEPSTEEIEIKAQIKVLSGLKLPNLEPQIQQLQQQLDKLEKDRLDKSVNAILPETEEKKISRSQLQEREETLLKQIGLTLPPIRFDSLEDQNTLRKCFTVLQDESNPVKVCDKNKLDAQHKETLSAIFKSLEAQINRGTDYSFDFENIESFEMTVFSSSLIKTILSKTNPEIGTFLHLDEMDPTLVREFDKKIVSTTIKNCIGYAIGSLNMSFIEKLLDEFKNVKSQEERLKSLKGKAKELQDRIFELLGIPPSKNPEEANKEWKRIQQEYLASSKEIEKLFLLPLWGRILLGSPSLIVPVLIIGNISKNNAILSKKESDIKETLDNYITELDNILKALIRLESIESIINKQDTLDKAFLNESISLDSTKNLESSMLKRIDIVKKESGNDAWSQRVNIIKDAMLTRTKFKDYTEQLKNGITDDIYNVFLAGAYYILEPSAVLDETSQEDLIIYNPQATQIEKVRDGGLQNKLVTFVNKGFFVKDTAKPDLRWFPHSCELPTVYRALFANALLDLCKFYLNSSVASPVPPSKPIPFQSPFFRPDVLQSGNGSMSARIEPCILLSWIVYLVIPKLKEELEKGLLK